MKDLVLLVGGKGLRLRELTKENPKCLVKIQNKPFLYYLLKKFEKNKIKNIFLCSKYKSSKIQEFINNYKSNKLNIKIFNDGRFFLGTGGSVKKIIKHLDDNFFVQNGDTFIDINYNYLKNLYFRKNLPLICYSNFKSNILDQPNLETYGSYVNFYSKVKKLNNNNNAVDAGLYIFKKSNFDLIKKDSFDLSILIQRLIKNKKLIGYKLNKKFHEIGSFKGIDEFNKKIIEMKINL